MEITDCVWEIANIGKKTCEVLIEENDKVGIELLNNLNDKFDYQVVKVAPSNVEANIFLTKNGFYLVETQAEIELKYKDFNFDDPLVRFIEPGVSFSDITEKEDFETIFDRMTPEMFSTDRLALDPYFGLEFSYKRYSNWMRTSFNNKSASFFHMIYKGEQVGFSMYRIKGNVWHGDLGGVYPQYGQGLGLLTACSAFIYMKQRGFKVNKLVSAISTNNGPVIPTFNHCHYNFKKFKYVFVKHNDN